MSAISQISQRLQHEVITAGVSNAFFNGVIAWLLLRGGAPLTLGGAHSYAVDIAATAFILPFIVALIVIPLNRRKLRRGLLPAVRLDSGHWLDTGVRRFPGGLALQALWMGLLGLLLFAPLTLLPLWILGVDSFSPDAYAVFKGAWAGLLAAALTPPLLLLALREA